MERGELGPPAKRRKVVERDEQEIETLLTSLSELSDAINLVVDGARAEYNCAEEVEKFVSAAQPNLGVRKLWSHVGNYVECLQVNGVKTYKELEDLWKSHYGKTEIRDVVDRVLEAEDHHEVFLKEVEGRFVEAQDTLGAVKPVTVGDSVMGGLKVTDAQSVEVKELRMYWEKSKVTLFVLLRHFG